MLKVRNNKGISVLEIMIWAGVFAILIPAIVTLFDLILKLSSKSYKLEQQMTVQFTGEGQILKDIRSGSKVEMGNLVLNGGFELEESETQPRHWHAAVTGTGSYEYVQSNNPQEVKNGLYSLSLVSTDGNQVTYLSSHTFTLTPDAAYMLNGEIRRTEASTDGTIEMIRESDSTVLAFGGSGGGNWTAISTRFPSAGLLGSAEVARIRLKWNGGGVANNKIYFDDINVTPIHAILASQTETVNITHTISDVTDPADSAGYRMLRWEGGELALYRYRIQEEGGINIAFREFYDYDAGKWTLGASGKSIQGILRFVITYDEDSDLPSNGKNTPLKMYFEYIDPSDNTGVGKKKYTVLPAAP